MSAKTNPQPGRRTPLSLSGGVKQQQHQSNKQTPGSSGITTATNSVNPKNDNKNPNQKTDQSVADSKDTKKQQQQSNAEKKQQMTSEKKPQQQQPQNNTETAENGIGKSNGSGKEKQQQQNDSEKNGNEVQLLAKEKKDKPERAEKSDKLSKEEKKDKAAAEKKEAAENKEKDAAEKKPEKEEKYKKDSGSEIAGKNLNKSDKVNEGVKTDASNNDEEATKQTQKSLRTTPIKAAADKKIATTPIKSTAATPARASERKKTPAENMQATPTKHTPAVVPNEDIDMEPLTLEASPIKSVTAVTVTNTSEPVATSTPGKITADLLRRSAAAAATAEVQMILHSGDTPNRNACPRSFSQISGRRSIRPLSEYTPSKFQSNVQFRETYRRINAELDVSSNTSLNVTVGSEVPNTSSFSLSAFLGRGRKRERTPPLSQSTIELHADGDSPPKRVRLDAMHGFFSAVSSPISMLRLRFSKAAIQSNNTPTKLSSKLAAADKDENEGLAEGEVDVQNVSGISIEEESPLANASGEEVSTTEIKGDNVKVDNMATEKNSSKTENEAEGAQQQPFKCVEKILGSAEVDGSAENIDDIKISEMPISGDVPAGKNKQKCCIM